MAFAAGPPTNPYSNGGVPPLPVIVIAPFVNPQLVIWLTFTAPNTGVPGAVILNSVPETEQLGEAITLVYGVILLCALAIANILLTCQVLPSRLYCNAPEPPTPVKVTPPSADEQLLMCFIALVTPVGALGAVIV